MRESFWQKSYLLTFQFELFKLNVHFVLHLKNVPFGHKLNDNYKVSRHS